jgi:hypothetical protein
MKRLLNAHVVLLIIFIFSILFASDYPKRAMPADDIRDVTEEKIDIRKEASPKKYKIIRKHGVPPKRIDISSGKPRDPDEIYSCDDTDTLDLDDEPVCAHSVIIVQCVRAPCPSEEKWVSYRTAKKACAANNIMEYALGSCVYDQ